MRPAAGRREPRTLVLIVTSYALGGLGFSLLMPPWEAPDETMHYSRILSYSDFWAGPRNYEARQPPLYYWLAAGSRS